MARSLIELLDERCSKHPRRNAFTFLIDGESVEASWTYEDMHRRAGVIAAWLQEHVKPGDRVLISHGEPSAWIVAFLGCVYAGAIAVPLASTKRNSGLEHIAQDCAARCALVDRVVAVRLAANPAFEGITLAVVDEISKGDAVPVSCPVVERDPLLIQYTSGSTGKPKGAIITHGNVLANQAMIQTAFGHDPDSVFVGWLPLFHDMGLMGNVLQPLFLGTTAVLMTPGAFLERPARWLRAISRYRAHTSGGPDFAYALCTRVIRDEELGGLDLSSWQVAFNGAEPIRARTLRGFRDRFSSFGFREAAFLPCYGLAEATLLVTGARNGTEPKILSVDATLLEEGSLSTTRTGERLRDLVSCGPPAEGLKLKVIKADGIPGEEGEIGLICVSGPSISPGYWGQPEGDAVLQTADVGAIVGGQLVVLGRADDVLVIRGLKHHPEEIEATADHVLGPESHGCAAFGVTKPDGETAVVLAVEVRSGRDEQWRLDIQARLRAAVATEHGIHLDHVALVVCRSLPRTTSGKIRRSASRDALLQEKLRFIDTARQPANEMVVDPNVRLRWLCDQIAQILNVAPESVDTGLPVAALGLDSLNAAQLCHAAFATRWSLSLEAVLAAGSLVELARLNERAVAETPEALVSSDEVPLSRRQEALWFFQQYAPGSRTYHLAFTVQVFDEGDVGQLRTALQRAVARHPQLRCVFRWDGSKPIATLSEWPKVEWCDSRGSGDAAFESVLELDREQRVDLGQGPVFRATVFDRGDHKILQIVTHHIVVDLWSVAVLLREVGARLSNPEAFSVDTPVVGELAVAARERGQLEAFERDGGLQRLLARLEGAQPIELPPSPWSRALASSPYEIDTTRFDIGDAGSEWIRHFALRQKVTPTVVLMAIYAVILHRYFSATEFVLGTPTWGRDPQSHDHVGCLVNTVIVRCSLAGDPDFGSVCSHINRAFLAALVDASCPFADAVQAWRSHTRSERFVDALFTFQRIAVERCDELSAFALGLEGASLQLGSMRLKNINVPRLESEFPIDLALCESSGRYLGYVATQRRHVPQVLNAKIAGYVVDLVRRLADDSNWHVSSGEFIASPELKELDRWHTPRHSNSDRRTIWDLFVQQATRNPTQVALVGESGTLSYGELRDRCERLATALVADTAPGAVALLLPAGISWCVSMWAAVRARRAFVPVDVTDPAERLARLMTDAGVNCLICDSSTAGLANELAGARHPLRIVDASHTTNMPLPAPPEGSEVVYIVFTSGSTGRPKGVPITHQNLNHLMLWLADEFKIGTSTKTLQSLPVCFDFGLEEVFSTLLFGATLYTAPSERHLDPEDYIRQLHAHGITMAYWTPSMAATLVSSEIRMETLRVILLGGERLDRGLTTKLRGLVSPECRIFNGYGPTEAAINSSMLEIHNPHDFAESSRSIPIGGPSGSTKLYVVNAAGSLAPLFAVGELWIGGVGVASGYLARQDLTAERFLADKFSAGKHLVYRTGDHVRWIPGGVLEFLGRADDQVKLRGHRIELGEIEQVIEATLGVVSAAVVAVSMGPSVVLVAFVSCLSEALSAAKTNAAQLLPRYMIPAQWFVLATLPLTLNGKVDRSVLSKMASELLMTAPREVPRDELELQIWQVWEDELGVAPVSVRANFFDSGGHSMAAIGVQRKLEVRLGRTFPVAWILEYPSVESLARQLRTRKTTSDAQDRAVSRALRLRAAARALRDKKHQDSRR